jgi:hypothetical protein
MQLKIEYIYIYIKMLTKLQSIIMNFAMLRSSIPNRSNGKQKLMCLIIAKHKQLILRSWC